MYIYISYVVITVQMKTLMLDGVEMLALAMCWHQCEPAG